MKLPLSAFLLVISLFALAPAQAVPIPRTRPAAAPLAQPPDLERVAEPEAPTEPGPSACQQRLTAEFAVAPSLPPIQGPGDCGTDDVVRLEAVILANHAHVTVAPPAVVRCTFAEEIVRWVREDVVPALAPAARSLKVGLRSIDNYAAYDCRGRNRIAGAKTSEHGRGNALDIRSLKLSDGTIIGLADPHVSKEFRETLKKKTCARFATVLGPGSDGYHEDHIHVDLAERKNAMHMCHWDVRESDEEGAVSEAAVVPLPRPRPSDD